MEYNNNKVKLTRGAKALIKNAITELAPEQKDDRNEICRVICETVEQKYTGDNLDYQLSRMGISSTGKLLEKIDQYMLSNARR